ncbi:MAG: 50S ribosomal protein L23 [Thermoplasmatales archaeon]|nr:50S ribosomal protein L23 [Thermoplasmatales archaeon]MCK5261119.1 50S ribosomal protein L23 [Thermoplasmatales archaeon]
MDPFDVVLHPFVTEKSMNQMEKNNALEFIVKRDADKAQIKKSVEKMFDVKVKSVNTRITKDGKHATVIFMPEFNAEDIGMRIGVF